RDNVDDPQSVAYASTGSNWHTEDGLAPKIMHPGPEYKVRAFGRTVDSPTGQAAGDFLHVFLSVAAVNAQRVQLEEFARIVFVDSRLALGRCGRLRLGRLCFLARRNGLAVRARHDDFAVLARAFTILIL